MKHGIFFVLVFVGAWVQAQDSQLGTTRSEDLQIKARMEYERRNQKKPRSHTTQTQNQTQEKLKTSKPADSTSAPVGGPVVPPVSVTNGLQKSLICKNSGEIRELYVEYKGQGCELFYTKTGTTKSQARQSNGKSVCESVFEQMKSTIEKSGFACEQKAN